MNFSARNKEKLGCFAKIYERFEMKPMKSLYDLQAHQYLSVNFTKLHGIRKTLKSFECKFRSDIYFIEQKIVQCKC